LQNKTAVLSQNEDANVCKIGCRESGWQDSAKTGKPLPLLIKKMAKEVFLILADLFYRTGLMLNP